MQNGICPKCDAKTIYFSNARGSQAGIYTGDGQLLLNIYKDNRFIPSIDYLEMDSYVCRTCGYLEMFVRDKEKLLKLDDCSNWHKVE